jgi:Ser/Thr protein kinase RdoA (MazF antagonist)
MVEYNELTYLGRVRRLRKVAQAALADYGLAEARFKLVLEAGNAVYRVFEAHPAPAENDLYVPGQYLLRVHWPDYQATEALELELAWLAAMRREANLPVPQPVPTLDGRLLTQVSVPGVPGERNCSLLRWVQGRFRLKNIGPQHYRAQGRLMGALHAHAAQWQVPDGLTKRSYDWHALFKDVEGTSLTASEIWPLLPRPYQELFSDVSKKVRQVMDCWGQDPRVYGLIHADLGVDGNVLFWRGEARAIDFDDSGFGYWMYDLAVSLEHCYDDEDFPRFRDALLDGYAEVRTLPGEQLEHLELFLAAWYGYLALWCTAGAHLFPDARGRFLKRRDRAAGLAMLCKK